MTLPIRESFAPEPGPGRFSVHALPPDLRICSPLGSGGAGATAVRLREPGLLMSERHAEHIALRPGYGASMVRPSGMAIRTRPRSIRVLLKWPLTPV